MNSDVSCLRVCVYCAVRAKFCAFLTQEEAGTKQLKWQKLHRKIVVQTDTNLKQAKSSFNPQMHTFTPAQTHTGSLLGLYFLSTGHRLVHMSLLSRL